MRGVRIETEKKKTALMPGKTNENEERGKSARKGREGK